MTQHFAACISISQGAFDVTASVTLIHADEYRETCYQIKFPTIPPQSDPENAGEWLFHVLEDLVTNFDAHEIQSAETGPRGERKRVQK